MKVIKLLDPKDTYLLKSTRITISLWEKAKAFGIIKVKEPCTDECDECPYYPCDDKDLTIKVRVEALELSKLPRDGLHFEVRQ